MSDLIESDSCLVFFSILFNHEFINEKDLETIVKNKIGSTVKFVHDFFPMKSYYKKEMGNENSLQRLILVALNPSPRSDLVNLKIWSDQLEKDFFSRDRLRSLNLDVGILSLENMILATGKKFSHRVYLKDGVYADLNYIFENKTYKVLPWTYPDYSHPDFISFYNWIRGILLRKKE